MRKLGVFIPGKLYYKTAGKFLDKNQKMYKIPIDSNRFIYYIDF